MPPNEWNVFMAPQDWHHAMIICMRLLKLTESKEGICQGLMMRFVEAVYTKSSDDFDTIHREIANIFSQYKGRYRQYASQDNKRNKVDIINQVFSELSSELSERHDQSIVNVRAYFESVVLYQNPTILSEILDARIIQQEVERMSPFASSSKMIDERGTLKQSQAFYYGKFDAAEFIKFVEVLNGVISVSDTKEPILPFVIRLIDPEGNMHATVLVKNDKTWFYRDPNYPNLIKPSNIAEIFNNIPPDIYKNFKAFEVRLISGSKDETSDLETRLLELQGTSDNLMPQEKKLVLFLAASNGDLHCVKKLLEGIVLKDLGINHSVDPLFTAILAQHWDVANLLLEKGANPNLASPEGTTPLSISCNIAPDTLVEKLLKKGAKNKDLMLFQAIMNKKSSVVTLLLENEADPNTVSARGMTPLFLAAHLGNDDIVSILLQKGADPNKLSSDFTPFLIALQQGHVACLKTLIINKANLTSVDVNGYTYLHHAVGFERPDIVSLLLKNGADTNKTDVLGNTPLYYAINKGRDDIVNLLLKKEANPNMIDRQGTTYLCRAIDKGSYDIVQSLLKYGADPNQANTNGSTPLGFAVHKQAVEVINLLLSHGLNSTITFQVLGELSERFKLENVQPEKTEMSNTRPHKRQRL